VPITVTRLGPCFAAHSVLLFRGAALDDETQVAFSLRFGALEVTRSMNPAAGTPFARQSNLDITTGQVVPAGDRRMIYRLANMLSFKPVPALCSLLSGRIVPPEGGATEFVYRHEWQAGDLVVWDNRCVLHRATPYDTERHQRLMQRTAIAGDPAEPAAR
jgi:alpha-ketoglutarate-dependent 2,4-dichlorophenoxyacetate dioxygenase